MGCNNFIYGDVAYCLLADGSRGKDKNERLAVIRYARELAVLCYGSKVGYDRGRIMIKGTVKRRHLPSANSPCRIFLFCTVTRLLAVG